jgi:hypothetical protein
VVEKWRRSGEDVAEQWRRRGGEVTEIWRFLEESGGEVAEKWRRSGEDVAEQWRCSGEEVAEQWWSCGGAMVVGRRRWQNLGMRRSHGEGNSCCGWVLPPAVEEFGQRSAQMRGNEVSEALGADQERGFKPAPSRLLAIFRI